MGSVNVVALVCSRFDFRHRASGQPWLELEELPEVCAEGRAVRLVSSPTCVAEIEHPLPQIH